MRGQSFVLSILYLPLNRTICYFKIVNIKRGSNCDMFEITSEVLKATFHLTISMRDQRATGKIQRNNYRHGSCGPSLTGKTSSVSLIFTHGTHRNVKHR